MGGEAVANEDDIADPDGAQRFIRCAVETFGRLDTLVNNAGILRYWMIVNMSIDEWDSVIKVHLRGTFAPTRWAAEHWRHRSKAGETVDARLINTARRPDYMPILAKRIMPPPSRHRHVHNRRKPRTRSLRSARQRVYPTALSRLTEDVFAKAGLTVEAEADQFSLLNGSQCRGGAVVWLAATARPESLAKCSEFA